ncbi:probable NOT transcription complex subunit VIP2 isoform X2 [Impatiens glandulifera]|nr:probable NOT transcription complex subunit VIP2 isoform X2 [Impatiens glandulifera]
MHNLHGSFNVPSMPPGSHVSRNSSMNVPSSGVQQPSAGRFASNNLQMSHGSSHGHSGVATNRGGVMNVIGSPGFSSNTSGVGGSIPGLLPTSAGINNRNAGSGLGVPPIMANTGPRLTNTMGNISGGGNIGRNMSTGGGLNVSLTSRMNLASNSGGPGNLNVQGSNRIMSSVLQQASPQVMSMLGNSYPAAGSPLSQNHVQANLNSMGILNDLSNDGSPFDLNDFPQLTSRPSSSGGPQGQLGSLRKQGLGVSNIVQQNQDFHMQNEDFPALPGFKGGNAEYNMDLQQKDQAHESAVSMMQQSQHFPMGRSAGFNLGGTYSSHRPPPSQQQHMQSVTSSGVSFPPMSNQDILHMHGSDMFQSSHAGYPSQTSGASLGLRPLNSPNTISGMSSYDQLIQQYQQHHNPSQFRLQQLSTTNQSYRDQGLKSLQAAAAPSAAAPAAPDPFSLLGLLNVVRLRDAGVSSLALGIDLTTLGLNLNSTENVHKTFGSPWLDEPIKGDPEFTVPQCYYTKQPLNLNHTYFAKFPMDTLFYIFYSMPKDEAQLHAANELYNRGWFYHKELRLWFTRAPNIDLAVKTNSYERGTYICFDPNSWETIRKDNFVINYELVEKRPTLPQQH